MTSSYTADWGSDYAIVSCYNALPIGGGGLTLGRLNMKKLSDVCESEEAVLGDAAEGGSRPV